MASKTNYSKMFDKDYQNLLDKYNEEHQENKFLKYEYQLALAKIAKRDKKFKEAEEIFKKEHQNELDKKDVIIAEKVKKIDELEIENARLRALLNNDGTNSGISTSKTPINKNKVIPNTRVKSGKSIGGQKGHEKHKLEKFQNNEINDNVDYTLEKCPHCDGKLEEIGEVCKDELSYKFVTIKRRNHFKKYKCTCCNKEVHQNIPNHLKEENQYGSEVKAMALSLANEGNVSMNKIRRIIRGFSHDNIDMSEGFIAKLQKQASLNLKNFKEDLYKKLLTLSTVYWDDTIIMINTKRACLRFYGDDRLAYYTAHPQKNEEGIKEDNVLTTLSDNVMVMHDHNTINYKYSYQNLECNIHLIRDLEKCKNNTCHEWCEKFKKLVQKAIHDKNIMITESNGESNSFSSNYIAEFDNQYDDILLEGIEENKKDFGKYYTKEERALIMRILEYKDNYFLWFCDFTLPSDDNLSERSLRGVKTKMKVAGQFQNIKSASYYADIKTYIETCYRNNINPTDALIRLMEGNPFTVEEIFNNQKDDESN